MRPPENCKGEEHNELSRGYLQGLFLYVQPTRTVLLSRNVSRYATPEATDLWRKLADPMQRRLPQRKFRKEVC
jgi:hypothetical protein